MAAELAVNLGFCGQRFTATRDQNLGHREAEGLQPTQELQRLDAEATAPTRHPELPLEPYPMIIELDAGNIRERDDWGRPGALRRAGQAPERWHWVWTGTVFRLDHRTQTAGGRAVIRERGFGAPRQGLDGRRPLRGRRGPTAGLA